MIRQSRGAELCATHDNTNPNPSNCVEAYDETYKGRVTLTDRVVVGDPIRKSHLHWTVPYDVKDDAGNVAMTVYREVVVEEVDVDSLEASVKKEVKAAKDAEIKRAVDKAVFEERRRLESDNKRSGGMTVRDCPPCPKCDSAAVSSKKGERNVDLSICDRICEQRAQQCFVREDSYIIQALVLLEDYLPAQLVPPVLLCIVIFFSWKALQLLYRLFFNRDALFASNYDYTYDQERERNLQNSVTYFQGETPRQPQQNQQTPRQPMESSFGDRSNGPPRASLSADRRDDSGFFFSSGKSSTGGFSPAGTMPFSPPTGTNGSHQQRNGSPWSDPNDIYADSTPKPRGKITPRKPDSDDAHRSPRFSS